MINSLVLLVVYLIVLGVVFALLNYLIDTVPMFQPFRQTAKIILTLVGVLIAILLLLSFVGVLDGGLPRLRVP